ncbi:MAG TPA: LysR family transcriptional regulator [Amaricoccus sp.]|uniref:LysR family transcriptional regulator n=1 Tax=Amaricoccus sp. TaxID=1872485 RepID=UPI002B695119|nr:LysR family transcriptional regulator [Amaricoccus sp.]HMQ95552.1 LysR family transcriptional regulator [Amaricoccus sp.]HMR53784.1 LysR family transcriptional regulator [Amaricoccus sp.]HMR61213.1 LysR family transcriptional regulator [Amaricoccus sp.]HMU01582.1 LysR family transcriptional regulator [Amaricoccus sp.]
MRLDRLNFFMSVVHSGSIAAASREVNLAQPALSKHMRALEDELGVALFERSVRGVTLTKAGERLYERGTSVLRRIDQIRHEVVETGESPVGEVCIAIAASMAPVLAGYLFWRARAVYPDIDLRIRDAYTVMSRNLVRTGAVDVALVPNVAALENVRSLPLISQKFYLVGRSFPGGMGPTVELRDLRGFPLVMGTRNNHFRISLENIALREGHSLNIVIEQESIPVYRSIILSGPAYTVVPYSAFAEEIAGGALQAKEIVNPPVERVLSMAWNDSGGLSVATEAIKSLFETCVRELVAEGKLVGRILSKEPDIEPRPGPARDDISP